MATTASQLQDNSYCPSTFMGNFTEQIRYRLIIQWSEDPRQNLELDCNPIIGCHLYEIPTLRDGCFLFIKSVLAGLLRSCIQPATQALEPKVVRPNRAQAQSLSSFLVGDVSQFLKFLVGSSAEPGSRGLQTGDIWSSPLL